MTSLHFRKYGAGPRVVLAFHGYGQSEGHWRGMAAVLGPDMTLYAFDLFYHGHSKLPKLTHRSPKSASASYWASF